MLDLASRIGGKAYCILPEGLSQASKTLAKRLELRVECLSEVLEDTDLIVLVDTASPSQLGFTAGFLEKARYIVIDHHAQNSLRENALLAIYYPQASSASEIVALLYASLNMKPSSNICNALMAGILHDSRRFLIAGPMTFKAASMLYECCDYRSVVEAMRTQGPDYSERVARLKAASRLQLYRADSLLIAVTHVSAYESSVARSLLELGADIAIVASENKGELRVVGRARDEALRSLKLSLGRDIMAPLASMLGGTGGGHDAAAAATGRGDLDKALSMLRKLLEDTLHGRGIRLRRLD